MKAIYTFLLIVCLYASTCVTKFPCRHKVLEAPFIGATLSSPGYPFGYPNHLNCTWTLKAPEGYQVEVLFKVILTESCCDIIQLRDGNSSDAALLATYRGNSTTSIYASSFGSLFIEFKSDDSGVYDGFYAEYRVASSNKDCSAQYTATNENKSLASPGWPFGYDNNLHCIWTITAPKGKRVALTVISMETESCCDYLLIRYGASMDSELKNLGGTIRSSAHHRYLSPGETMQIVFRSDSSVTVKGFYASYNAVDVEQTKKPISKNEKVQCGGSLTVPRHGHQAFTTPQYPAPHANDLKCVWILVAPVNMRVVLWFTSVNTEKCCDFIMIRDGEFKYSRKLDALSGENIMFAFYVSSKNKLRVEFQSDRFNSRRGFRAVFETFQDSSTQPCGGNLRATAGMRKYISSPNWPLSPRATRCVWKITSPAGTSILFNVIGFRTDRFRDELLFYDGNSQKQSPFAIMNGRSTRTRYISRTSTLLVVFNSDITTTEGGFRGLYKAIHSRNVSPGPHFNEGTTSNAEF